MESVILRRLIFSPLATLDKRQISMIGHIFIFSSPYCGIFKINGSVSRRPKKFFSQHRFSG
jgi:hypothetical protein